MSEVQQRSKRAFTLVELLVVVAIMVVIMSFLAPAFTSILGGTRLERAGQTVADVLALARQEAVSKNREVQVAFFELQDGAGAKAWRGIEVWRIDDNASGPVTNRVGPPRTLPEEMMISSNADLSPLLAQSTIQGTTNFASNQGVSFKAIRFRPNGAVETSNLMNSFLTVQRNGAAGAPPPNYFTVQVNPVTGRVNAIRP